MINAMSDLTCAEYYAQYARDGRAALVGTRDNPALWLSLIPAPRGIQFALCFGVRDGIVFCQPQRRVKTLVGYMESVRVDYSTGRPRKQRAA